MEAESPSFRLAWCGQRLTATWIDLILLQLAQQAGMLVVHLRPDLAGLYPQVLSAMPVISYQAYLVSTTGQSWGKRFCGIKVVLRHGSAPGLMRGVLLRSWVPISVFMIGSATVGFLLDRSDMFQSNLFYLLFILDAGLLLAAPRRCLHDYLAGTRVVRV